MRRDLVACQQFTHWQALLSGCHSSWGLWLGWGDLKQGPQARHATAQPLILFFWLQELAQLALFGDGYTSSVVQCCFVAWLCRLCTAWLANQGIVAVAPAIDGYLLFFPSAVASFLAVFSGLGPMFTSGDLVLVLCDGCTATVQVWTATPGIDRSAVSRFCSSPKDGYASIMPCNLTLCF